MLPFLTNDYIAGFVTSVFVILLSLKQSRKRPTISFFILWAPIVVVFIEIAIRVWSEFGGT